MPQLDFDGANSLVKADKIQGQSASTVTVPTGHTLAVTDAGGLTLGGTAVNAGSLGKVLQVVNSEVSAVITGTTTMPNDDTIPQITEGTEVTTVSITPSNASNKLLILVNVMGNHTAAGTAGVALFQDSTANALAGTTLFQATAGGSVNATFNHYMTSGTTSSTTFKVRMGNYNAGTQSINGAGSARLFGGAMSSSITITEIAV